MDSGKPEFISRVLRPAHLEPQGVVLPGPNPLLRSYVYHLPPELSLFRGLPSGFNPFAPGSHNKKGHVPYLNVRRVLDKYHVELHYLMTCSSVPQGWGTLRPALLPDTQIRSGVSRFWWELVEAIWHGFWEPGIHITCTKTGAPWASWSRLPCSNSLRSVSLLVEYRLGKRHFRNKKVRLLSNKTGIRTMSRLVSCYFSYMLLSSLIG